jgi:hypothetical protein
VNVVGLNDFWSPRAVKGTIGVPLDAVAILRLPDLLGHDVALPVLGHHNLPIHATGMIVEGAAFQLNDSDGTGPNCDNHSERGERSVVTPGTFQIITDFGRVHT